MIPGVGNRMTQMIRMIQLCLSILRANLKLILSTDLNLIILKLKDSYWDQFNVRSDWFGLLSLNVSLYILLCNSL